MIRLIRIIIVCSSLSCQWICAASLDTPVSGKALEDRQQAAQSFTNYTDAELSRAAASFDRLRAVDRRALFTEIKNRMSKRQALKGRLRIEQRFGSIEARDDGTVVRMNVTRRIETSNASVGRVVESRNTTIEKKRFGSVNGENSNAVPMEQNPVIPVTSEAK